MGGLGLCVCTPIILMCPTPIYMEQIGRIHIRDGKPPWTGNCLPTENSSDMNPVKDEFPILNLSVYFSI